HEGVAIGSYPFFRDGRTGANFVVRATEQARLDACGDALAQGLASKGLEVVDGGI
ncbi:MAG: competence/damage-inducible protein A, partial [Sphingomonadales bacterium]